MRIYGSIKFDSIFYFSFHLIKKNSIVEYNRLNKVLNKILNNFQNKNSPFVQNKDSKALQNLKSDYTHCTKKNILSPFYQLNKHFKLLISIFFKKWLEKNKIIYYIYHKVKNQMLIFVKI
jgi:hypothetical protein